MNNIGWVVSVKVRVVGSQYKEDRMVERRGGKASPFGQADAHSVEDHCSHHRTYCCPVPGALRIPAVRFYDLNVPIIMFVCFNLCND